MGVPHLSSNLMGLSIVNHHLGGTSIFMETSMWFMKLDLPGQEIVRLIFFRWSTFNLHLSIFIHETPMFIRIYIPIEIE